MNHYAKHVKITSDVPIFGTGPQLIQWYAHHPDEVPTTRHGKEDEQMGYRCKKNPLTRVFCQQNDKKDIPVCPRCFAQLAMLGSN